MNIVVIGNGMVGYKFCEKLVARSAPHTFNITVIGEEPRPAYDRVHLSAYFSGTTVEELTMAPAGWYADNGIQLLTSELVTGIDRAAQTVTTQHGRTFSYDKLILATGSGAFVPTIKGVEKDGVFVYRTIEDLEAIISYSKKAKKAAVIGGGLLGLEAAKAVLDLGLEAHVVEFAPRLMPRQLDEAGSKILQSKLENLGIGIHLNKNTGSIEGENCISEMKFTDGTSLEVDMVVISAGIKPRDELATKSGLAIGTRGGIVVNDFLQTSDPAIYAIGECALHGQMIYGLVAPGYEMADVVVSQLIGSEKTFASYDMSTKLKLIGVDVASFGDPFCMGAAHRTIVLEDKVKGIYKRINITEDGKRLLGGVLVGEAESYNMLLQTVKNNILLPPNPEDMILGARGGSEGTQGSGVLTLRDEALICSCENVSKGTLCSAITEKELNDVKDIKKMHEGWYWLWRLHSHAE